LQIAENHRTRFEPSEKTFLNIRNQAWLAKNENHFRKSQMLHALSEKAVEDT